MQFYFCHFSDPSVQLDRTRSSPATTFRYTLLIAVRVYCFYPTADSYQYQLQSMWQKCWNTNQSLVHNLRFRERGPLKSWRPETMAEAILSVLKEGLSLSQAARKYDIPYPTFVLYANRVHNLLGPSADGGAGKQLAFIRHVMRAPCIHDKMHYKREKNEWLIKQKNTQI